MKKTGFLAGALALALLVGCSAGDSAGSGDLVAEPDDMAFQAADIRRDSEIVTVDGQPITAERYLFWLANAIGTVKGYGQLADDAGWEETLDDGMTVAEALKADALETAKLYRVVETKAAEYGVTLSPEQEQEIANQMAEAMEGMGGEEVFQARLDEMCISMDGFTAMNRVYYLNQGLKEKMEQSGELSVTQADVDQYKESFVEENGIYAAKHILLATRRTNSDGSYEEFTDEEKAAVLEQAQALRQQLKDAGDSEELFDELMNEFSEDGRDPDGNLYAPDGYGLVYAGQMVPEFEQGALALEVGQVSELIETSYGYHIIMRIPVDQAQVDQIAEESCTTDKKLEELTAQWVEQAQVVTTTAYDELDPKAFFERLTKLSEARAAARESAQPAESQTPAESPAPEASPEG